MQRAIAQCQVTLPDDALTGALNIGFPFNFYCNTYTQFYISSNGFITFSVNSGNGCCSGQLIPNAGAPNNLISAAWTDLDPGVGGSITYATIGSSPTRSLLVKYINVPIYGSTVTVTTETITVQSCLTNLKLERFAAAQSNVNTINNLHSMAYRN